MQSHIDLNQLKWITFKHHILWDCHLFGIIYKPQHWKQYWLYCTNQCQSLQAKIQWASRIGLRFGWVSSEGQNMLSNQWSERNNFLRHVTLADQRPWNEYLIILSFLKSFKCIKGCKCVGSLQMNTGDWHPKPLSFAPSSNVNFRLA